VSKHGTTSTTSASKEVEVVMLSFNSIFSKEGKNIPMYAKDSKYFCCVEKILQVDF
jgi:hypothetical protein